MLSQLRFLVLVRVRVGVPVFFLQQRPGLHDVLKGDMSLVGSRPLLLEYGLHAVKSFALRPAQVIASINKYGIGYAGSQSAVAAKRSAGALHNICSRQVIVALRHGPCCGPLFSRFPVFPVQRL